MEALVWEGVQCLLDEYAHVASDDVVVVMYTTDGAQSAAWVIAALEHRDIDVRRAWMNPLKDDGFDARLEEVMPAPDSFAGRIIVMTFERDTLSHNEIIRAKLAPFERSRRMVFRAINASSSLFSTALRTSPALLSALNTTLLERCMQAKRLRITSPSGTDLRITLDNDHYRWVSNRGEGRVGGTVVLPAGEIATFPDTVEGVLVANFAYNVNTITDSDARLNDKPVTVWIENRKAVRWHCEDAETMRFISECFSRECVRNVGELGIGTNVAIEESIALNSHINERCPGPHLGFGQHNQDPQRVGYECLLHLDLIAKGGMMWVDDDPVPIDLANITPSRSPHPISPRDEDAFSPESTEEDLGIDDCCGTLTCDGLKMFSEEGANARAIAV